MEETWIDRPLPGVARIYLNRREARNALNQAVREQLAEHFRKLGADPSVRCIVLSGGTQRLTRAVGKFQAMRMLLTGMSVNAEQALRMGLASEVVEDDQVQLRALELAEQIAGLPPLAVKQIKEVVLAGQDASLDTALMLERKAFQLLFDSADQKEGMRAFLDKREPLYQGR